MKPIVQLLPMAMVRRRMKCSYIKPSKDIETKRFNREFVQEIRRKVWMEFMDTKVFGKKRYRYTLSQILVGDCYDTYFEDIYFMQQRSNLIYRYPKDKPIDLAVLIRHFQRKMCFAIEKMAKSSEAEQLYVKGYRDMKLRAY